MEGGALFALALQRLKTLCPGAYTWGSTYTIGPLGPEYELERLTNTQEAGTTIYLLPFGGDYSPIQTHECREADVGYEAGVHADLSPIIHDKSPGKAQYLREYPEDGPLKTHPPTAPHPPQREVPMAKFRAVLPPQPAQ